MKGLRDIFIFTRRERLGIISLIVIITGLLSAPAFLPKNNQEEIEKWQLASFVIYDSTSSAASDNSTISTTATPSTINYFYFDPNILPDKGFKQLGMPERLIKTIINFREKGGKFRKPEDLKKIFGMPEDLAEKLIPYVQIKSTEKSSPLILKNQAMSPDEKTGFQPSGKNSEPIKIIDINSADSTELRRLRGIGPTLAARIINYRESLGGFYTADQIKEVYGIKEEVYTEIRPLLSCNNNRVKKINLNVADLKTLGKHPYIKNNFAGLIIKYRNQHGSFNSLEDLNNLIGIDKHAIDKMLPYLEVVNKDDVQ